MKWAKKKKENMFLPLNLVCKQMQVYESLKSKFLKEILTVRLWVPYTVKVLIELICVNFLVHFPSFTLQIKSRIGGWLLVNAVCFSIIPYANASLKFAKQLLHLHNYLSFFLHYKFKTEKMSVVRQTFFNSLNHNFLFCSSSPYHLYL